MFSTQEVTTTLGQASTNRAAQQAIYVPITCKKNIKVATYWFDNDVLAKHKASLDVKSCKSYRLIFDDI